MRLNCSAEAVALALTVFIGLCPCCSAVQGATASGPGGPEWGAEGEEDPGVLEKFQIVGRAAVHGVKPEDWTPSALVLLDGEDLLSFIRLDGSFTVNDVPSGSYVVQIASPSYRFEPVRVDITSMGKIRARRVNYVKTSEVVQLPYPLQMRCTGLHSYFIQRETWGWSDFLMNPMVLMMVLPLVIILLLPKVINTNDPGMRREMEQSMNMLNPNPELPDVSEIMTKFFAPPKSHGGKPGGGGHSGHRGHRGSGPRRR